MKAFPLYYKGIDYWITTNGRIFDWDNLHEITKDFSHYERCRMVAACWIGESSYQLLFKDGNSKNISRKNINYEVPKIIKLRDGNLLIGNEVFYKINGYKYYYVSKNAIFYSSFYKKFLHKKVSKFPHYVKISLVNNEGIRDTCAVHRVVFYTINGRSLNPDMEINHIDGRKWFNCIENLEETTSLENTRHAMFSTNTRENLWNPNEIHSICKMIQDGLTTREIYNNDWISEKLSYDSLKVLVHHLINHTKFWVDISSKYNLSNWNSISKKYSDETIHEICRLLENGKSPKEIEDQLNVPLKYISSIKTRSARKDISSAYNF